MPSDTKFSPFTLYSISSDSSTSMFSTWISNNILSNLDYRAKLRSFNGESLIIFSKNDVWPKSASQKLRNDLINAKYIELDTGHFPMIENAEKFWLEIFDFALN